MNQITNEGKYCGDCFCLREVFVPHRAKCLFYGNRIIEDKRLPECIAQRPQIFPTANFNHEACAKLWGQIGNDFMGEGREEK